jgi:hypothetical protein
MKKRNRRRPEDKLKRDVNLELLGGDRRERSLEEEGGLAIDRSLARWAIGIQRAKFFSTPFLFVLFVWSTSRAYGQL